MNMNLLPSFFAKNIGILRKLRAHTRPKTVDHVDSNRFGTASYKSAEWADMSKYLIGLPCLKTAANQAISKQQEMLFDN